VVVAAAAGRTAKTGGDMMEQPLQERKRNQRQGFFSCLGINAFLLFIWYFSSRSGSPSQAANTEIFLAVLPWIINIGILILAFVLRPQFAVGYLAFFAAVIVGSMVLGMVFMTACFASVVTMLVLSPLGEAGNFLGLFCVLPAVFLGGVYWMGKVFLPQIEEWWWGDGT
jgi:hypothetical protein